MLNFNINILSFLKGEHKVKIRKLVLALVMAGMICTFFSVSMAAEESPADANGVAPAASEVVSGTPLGWFIAPVAAFMALGFAIYFYKKMMEASEGTDKMKEIAKHVREGAYAYLYRQYGVVTLVFIILLGIFAACAYYGVQNPFVPLPGLQRGRQWH